MSSIECVICLDEMTEPWSIISQGAKDQPEGDGLELHQNIVCTHSFCKECLLEHIETCDQNGRPRICPTCKVVIAKIYKNIFATNLIQERIALDKKILDAEAAGGAAPDPSIIRDLEEKARIAEEGRIQALLEKAQAEQNVEEIRRTIEEQNQLLERSRRLKEEAEARHQEFLDELARRAEEMRLLALEKEEQTRILEEARMEANKEHDKIEELERNLRAKEKEIEETAQNLKELEEQNALNLENLNQFQSKASILERSLQSLRAARSSISSSASASSSSSASPSSSSSAPAISYSAGSYLSSIMKAFGFGSKDPSVPDYSFNPQDFKIFERRGVSKRSGVSRAEVVATKKEIALKQKFFPPNSPSDLHASLIEAFLLRHFKYVPSFISSQKIYFSLPDASSQFTYNEEKARICMELEPFMRYDLEFMINERRNLFKDIELIKTVMYRLLVGLNELHSAGIVHYQIFPNNVLFESLQGGAEKTCRLAGFGSANFVQFFRSSNPIPVPSRYSLNFTAPEIFLHIIHSLQRKPSLFPREYNWTSADIWSCGCIMAMMFLGRSLFQATSRSEYLEAIAAVEECNFSGLRRGVKVQKRSILDKVPDADAADLLSRMIKTDPKSRISAKDCLRHPFFDDIRSSHAHNFSAPPPPSPSPEDFQAFLEEIKVIKPDSSSSSSSSSSA